VTRFSTIVADPPWPYHSQDLKSTPKHRPNRDALTSVAAVDRYSLMGVPAIKRLPVATLARDNAHLYLWTTNSFMVEAHEVAEAWGFKVKTIITWVKVKPTGEPSMKMGYWYRSASEHCLFAVRGRLRLNAVRGTGVCLPTWFAHRRLPHSAKPDVFMSMVEGASPEPYLELFARRPRAGWSVWGNEVSCDVDLLKVG
jgi:N6-adenosine-specific RNA methylase IME4